MVKVWVIGATHSTALTLAFRRVRVIFASFSAHNLFFSDKGVSSIAKVFYGISILWAVFRIPQVHAIGHITRLITCYN